MKELAIGQVKIGAGHPTVVIAEIAECHNGSMETAKRMVDAIKVAGAQVAKFQLHLPGWEMAPKTIKLGGVLFDDILKNTFTSAEHKELMEYCESVGVEYLCTPFCPRGAEVLNDLGVKAFKTGSGELTNLPQHRVLAKISAKTGKPVIVSTGMCKWEEIRETVQVYEDEGAKDNLVLMNCTSEYPPNNYANVRLRLIPRLQNEFEVWVGQSDHTTDNYTAFAAVALGAKIVEKHFTLSRKMEGPDHAIALEPDMLKELVDGIRKTEAAVNAPPNKDVLGDEAPVRHWAFHSVVTNRRIKKGERITLKNVRPARPGWGIPAKFLDGEYVRQLLGKRAKKNLPKNAVVYWEDLEK